MRKVSSVAAIGLLVSQTSAQVTTLTNNPPGYGLTEGAGPSFINWENPPVSPMAITPDESLLLVVNLPDNRLEVFDLTSGSPTAAGSIPVGLDPVSVRVRSNSEAWVVNHISDSISIVDLGTMRVRATIDTGDEPYDVVFAGSPEKAFVSCSQINQIQVFDAKDPFSEPPQIVSIDGEDPRALATNGSQVFVAIFESGNASTVLGGGVEIAGTLDFPPNVVNSPLGPWAGLNPPPNDGAGFNPPINPALGGTLPVGLIVQKDVAGNWMDDNGGDWTDLVSGANADESGRLPGWDLPDRDLAIIDVNTMGVSYVHGLMNINMAMGINPVSGVVSVVGEDGTNATRFEPVLKGKFMRMNLALVDPGSPQTPTIVDLNPHLDYSTSTIPANERAQSIGNPRAIAWMDDGSKGFVAGTGSNNVIMIDAAGSRVGDAIPVGEGAAGLALDEARGNLYVFNRFDASISVVDLTTSSEVDRVPFFDPTPESITIGRKHLYDTHRNSGLGHISCASCHVDARMDRLAWDLGDPSGEMEPLNDLNMGFGFPGLTPGSPGIPAYDDHHPMKGPMTTQTLQDIIEHEPHHWRGDRSGIEAFNPAFVGLNGADSELTNEEMQEFEDTLASIYYPPNPFRNFDNTLPTDLPLPGHYSIGRFLPAGQPLPNGNAVLGRNLYRSTVRRVDGGGLACVTCHTLPTGMGPDMEFDGSRFQDIPAGPLGERHLAVISIDGATNHVIKIPQLRNMHEKTGFNATILENNAGFGFLHDGSIDSIERFVGLDAFDLRNVGELSNLVAFMLAFSGSDLPGGSQTFPLLPPGPPSQDTHAAVGTQTTLADAATAPFAQLQLISSMVALADNGTRTSVVVKGLIEGEQRGFAYVGGDVFQSDRGSEAMSEAKLLTHAVPGGELTFTVVPRGTELRIGIDRDEDGWFDRDELDVCGDPADPTSFPGSAGSLDVNANLVLNTADMIAYLNLYQASDPQADFDRNGTVELQDALDFFNAFASGCEG